jgi:hypothetical protein
MAHITNLSLKDELKDTLNGDANYKKAAQAANIDLVDSIYHTEVANLTFTSGSGTQTFSALKVPAGSIIREYGILITSQSGRASSTVGFRIGTTSGGTDLATTSIDGLQGSGTTLGAGTGSFTVAALTTAANGSSSITIAPGSVYRSADTDVFVQISASAAGFASGQATAYVSYVKL